MKEMKLISIMIVTVLIGAGLSSISVAQPLGGQIDVEVSNFIGIVSPVLNLDNESTVDFSAEFVEEGNNSYYKINDSLEINLDVTNNMGRDNLIFSRSLFYAAVLIRTPKITFTGGFFKRMLPVLKFGVKPIMDSMLVQNSTPVIKLPVNYTLGADSIGTEEMTLHLFTMGMIPGDVNGIEGLKIVDYQKVSLTVDYNIVS